MVGSRYGELCYFLSDVRLIRKFYVRIEISQVFGGLGIYFC